MWVKMGEAQGKWRALGNIKERTDMERRWTVGIWVDTEGVGGERRSGQRVYLPRPTSHWGL